MKDTHKIKHPIIKIIGVFIKNIDENPKIQNRIHTVGFYYWILNFPIVTYLFFFQQGIWSQYGLFITLIYSIYANFTSDYTGMSASQGIIQTQVNTTGDVEITQISELPTTPQELEI